MPLTAGTRLGVFEILAPLGKGGMGEVYRAKDTKLEREIALKILPEEMAKRPERMARFQREAKLLAALDQPHIAAIHGLHEEDGQHFLVMELVDDENLADRLKRGPLVVPEALELGRQIAEALEAAHEKDIIHRDLKPSNVMLTSKGRAKVLDFGLGRMLEQEGFASSINTETTPDETGTGVVMGTAPYMSPEQARGDEVDHRTDIWSLGCVLFEMLSGQRAFPGRTTSDTIVAVLDREPDWEALHEATPLLVRFLLRRCLQKDQGKRLHDIADARIEIEEALSEPEPGSSVTLPLRVTGQGRRQRTSWAVGGVVIGALSVGIAWLTLRPSPPARRIAQRLSIVPSRKAPIFTSGNRGALALSPDGTRLVYVARVDGKSQLYLRQMDQLEATPIPGTEGARTPFFSPNGQWVGFVANRKLKKISLQGGQPITIGDSGYRGASWGENDTVLFEGPSHADLWRVSAGGGTPQLVSTPNTAEGEASHRWPQILPGGKGAIFTIQPASGRHDETRIAILSLENGESRILLEGGTLARYVPSGHVIYTRYGSLLAVPFDLQRLEVTGTSVPVIEDVAMFESGAAYLAVSSTGSLAYLRRRYAPPDRSLVWLDRQGKIEPVTDERRAFRWPSLSPDGTRLAVDIRRSDGEDVWVYDLRQRTWTRLTFEKDNHGPIWSPDGRWLAFGSNRDGPYNIFRVPADGGGAPERLRASPHWEFPQHWSADGRFLLFNHQAGTGQSFDLWVLPLEEEAEATPYLATKFREAWGLFSPDGHWVATESNESGRLEVYVRSFPDPGRKWTISTDGGRSPLWSPDGRRSSPKAIGSSTSEIWCPRSVHDGRGPVPRS